MVFTLPYSNSQEGNTVGAVAVDKDGHVAYASSTGGMVGQMPGRMGDSPIIGTKIYGSFWSVLNISKKFYFRMQHGVIAVVECDMYTLLFYGYICIGKILD